LYYISTYVNDLRAERFDFKTNVRYNGECYMVVVYMSNLRVNKPYNNVSQYCLFI